MTEKNESQTITGAIASLVQERFKSNYFAYVLSSLILFNWQNLLLIISSKKDIELIIHQITHRPDAINHFFIYPIICGYLGAIILPFLTLPVLFFTGFIKEASPNVEGLGGKITKSIRKIVKLLISWFTQYIDGTQLKIDKSKNECEILEGKLKSLQITEERFFETNASLVNLWRDMPKSNDEISINEYMKAIKESNCLSLYSENSEVRAVLEEIVKEFERKGLV